MLIGCICIILLLDNRHHKHAVMQKVSYTLENIIYEEYYISYQHYFIIMVFGIYMIKKKLKLLSSFL